MAISLYVMSESENLLSSTKNIRNKSVQSNGIQMAIFWLLQALMRKLSFTTSGKDKSSPPLLQTTVQSELLIGVRKIQIFY